MLVLRRYCWFSRFFPLLSQKAALFSPLCNPLPHSTSFTTRHPSLYLKNRMKLIECRGAFQHLSVSFFSCTGPARHSTSAFKALFIFLPSSFIAPLHHQPPQSNSSTSTLKRGSFFMLPPSPLKESFAKRENSNKSLRFIRTCTIAHSLLSHPPTPKMKKKN